MQQVELLAESIQASEKWEETEAQLHRLQSEPPTLETKLGHLIQAKLREVMLFKDVADDMGADANGLLGKDSFVKYVMGQRGNGQLRIDGGDRTAVETLGNLFEKLANGPRQPKHGASETNENMDVNIYFELVSDNIEAAAEKEEKLVEASAKAQEQAKTLQVAYAKEAARRAKQSELEAKGDADASRA